MDNSLNPTLQRLLALCRLDRTWFRGEGVWLYDEEGRPFLDCYAQYGAVALGHNAPVVCAAVRAALDKCEPAFVQPYRAPHAVALADELTRLAPGMDRCVFTTSGAEAVEAAIKLVRARSGRTLILSANGSFHGKTLGALAATGQPFHSEGLGPLPTDFEHVPFGDEAALAARLGLDAGRTAAVLLEPIQGEGGVILPPTGYLPRVRELCTRHGVALVLDEIQTGLGRTGKLFACEHEKVEPDVLVLAKGLGGGLFPLGACLSSARWWDDGFGLRHSSTFGINNVACRVGRAVLKGLTREGICEAAARRGERLRAGLRRLARTSPRLIAAVRSAGLLGAIELRPRGHDGFFPSFLHHYGLYAYAVAACLAELGGVLLKPTMGERSVLRLTPPLTISDEELELALGRIEQVFLQLQRQPAETLARVLCRLDEPEPVARRPHSSPVPLPPPLPRTKSTRCFAFIAHPTRPEEFVFNNPGMERLSPDEVRRFGDYVAKLPPVMVHRVPAVRGVGASAEGFVFLLPWMPEEMARRGMRQVSEQIARAVDLAGLCGARVVGLGGHTAPFTRRGLAVVGRGPAITTGNVLTAGMTVAACRRVVAERGLDLKDATVGVVGARGSIGSLCARLLAQLRPSRVVLIGNPSSSREGLHVLSDELSWGPDRVRPAGFEGLEECQLIVTATGAARPVLDDVPLLPGAIVCDVARPGDTTPRLREREDVFVFEGGLVTLPDWRRRFGPGNLVGLPEGIQLACLCETILLALEGDDRDHGIGPGLTVGEVEKAMALAEKHGFTVAPPTRAPVATTLTRTCDATA